jgi:hypothetical protein
MKELSLATVSSSLSKTAWDDLSFNCMTISLPTIASTPETQAVLSFCTDIRLASFSAS